MQIRSARLHITAHTSVGSVPENICKCGILPYLGLNQRCDLCLVTSPVRTPRSAPCSLARDDTLAYPATMPCKGSVSVPQRVPRNTAAHIASSRGPDNTAPSNTAEEPSAMKATSKGDTAPVNQPPYASMASSAKAAAADGSGLPSLPPKVLRHILRLASTCQAPGSCLAAPVCRSWRAAVATAAAEAGSSGIHLLYRVGHAPADHSLASWFRGYSGQLESFVISGNPDDLFFSTSDLDSIDRLLGSLADAAEAAAAAGRPLPLHTLRVLGKGTDLGIVARLVEALPHLRCLQLDMSTTQGGAYTLMEALQQAPQLQKLYCVGPTDDDGGSGMLAFMLPGTLQRLGLQAGERIDSVPDLSHLNKLRYLHLQRFLFQDGLFSSKLPRGLEELEAVNMSPIRLEQMQGEARILTGCSEMPLFEDEMQVLAGFSNMKTLYYVESDMFPEPEVAAAMEELSHLSAMELTVHPVTPLQRVTAPARGFRSLRRLQLSLQELKPNPVGLGALTQVTRLVVTSMGSSSEQQQRAWVAEVGRMSGLRWLSVPDVLLAVDQAWLGGLEQLQVLVLSSEKQYEGDPEPPPVLPHVLEWLEGCSPQSLPPRLLLLGFSDMSPEQAAALQVRRRLAQLVDSSGCEVVVGVDLDEVAHPMKQLAGLPVALQQALG